MKNIKYNTFTITVNLILGVINFLFLFSVSPFLAFSGETPSFTPLRISDLEIKIDGRLNEEVWQQATPINSWYRQTPDEGADPSQKTIMRLVYDDEYIYLSAQVYESNISKILARTLERDSYSPGQDAICILLDTYNDDRTAYGFIVTPAGVRTDVTVSNDGEGFGRGWNAEWDAFWDASVLIDENGWTAELRIPFSSLRFESKNETVEMGLILWRYIARNVEYNVYPAIPNKWQNSAVKPSQALDIKFDKISSQTPLYIKPYTIGGLNKSNTLREDESAYDLNKDWKKDIGLDVKYNITSNLILDLTVNTDFAQVEVDDQRINTTRFSLFFPEKRDFFQERADLFTFRFPGGRQRLFQSRRIGIVDGQQVPILGGVRLTGRIGGWEMGLIEMQADKAVVDNTDIHSENFGVFRLRREVFERGSFIGGLLTSRTGPDGNHNTAIGLDGDIRVIGPQYLKIHFSQSYENNVDLSETWYASVTMQRRIRRGFSFGTSASHYGSQFNPGLGFLTRNGVDRFGGRLQYTWFPGTKNKLQNHSITNRTSFIWDATSTRKLETFDSQFNWNGLFKSGATARATLRHRHELIREPFNIGDVEIMPDIYNFQLAEFSFGSPAGYDFRVNLRATAGEYFGGNQYRAVFSPSWTINEHLAFTFDYEYNRIEANQKLFNAHLTRMRIRTAINHALTINSFIQYNSDISELAMNVRLRYNPSEGSDLYLVYNENINTTLNPEDELLPRLPRSQNRAVLLKFSHTFVR